MLPGRSGRVRAVARPCSASGWACCGPRSEQLRPAWGRHGAEHHVSGLCQRPGVAQVAAGNEHSLALLSDGRVLAWGRNQYGQLGDGTNVNRNLPVFVLDPVEDKPLEGMVQIASYADADSSFALLRDGRLLAWGYNWYGTLGDASRTNRARPVFVKGIGGTEYLTGVLQVAPGGCHTLALLSDGRVAVWGRPHRGQAKRSQ